MITLKCNCQITDEGNFIVSEQCQQCYECNTISETHPFGEKRLEN